LHLPGVSTKTAARGRSLIAAALDEAKAAADDAKLDFQQYALKRRSCHFL